MRPALLAPALALLAPACGSAREAARPNCVLIVVDTLRADHASPEIMPTLAALARDGARFERAFSHAPATLPSHASLFSSRPPFESDVKVNAQPLPEGLGLLPSWMARFGYRSAAAVSLTSLWPLQPGTSFDGAFDSYVFDGQVDCWPAERVTAESLGLLESLAAQEDPFLLFAHYSDPHDPFNAHGTVDRQVDVVLDGELFERMSVSEFGFVRIPVELQPGEHEIIFRAEEPFRLRLFEPRAPKGILPVRWTSGTPHTDTTLAAARIAQPESGVLLSEFWIWLEDVLEPQEARARYRLEAEYADAQIARLLDDLRRRGLYDSSLIVVTADHGEGLDEHGHTGHVVNLYDEALHVPLIIKPPAGSTALDGLRAASERLVRLMDVAPTVLDLLGLPALPGALGVSLLDAGAAGPLLAETHAPLAPRTLFCLRDERHKLILHVPGAADDWSERFELYDLAADPGELEDIFAARGGEFGAWQDELRRVARLSAERGTATPELGEAAMRRLKALGY